MGSLRFLVRGLHFLICVRVFVSTRAQRMDQVEPCKDSIVPWFLVLPYMSLRLALWGCLCRPQTTWWGNLLSRSRTLPKVIQRQCQKGSWLHPWCCLHFILWLPAISRYAHKAFAYTILPQGICSFCSMCYAEPFKAGFGYISFLKEKNYSLDPRKDPTCRKGWVCLVSYEMILLKKNNQMGLKEKSCFPSKEPSSGRLWIIHLWCFFITTTPSGWS